jgi:hypothetical protein
VVQGLSDEPLAGRRLTRREQLFTLRSDANIVLVARLFAPVHYMQCTESFSISANDVPCHSCRKAVRVKHQRHYMQATCSHTTDIGRTLAIEHVIMIGKVDGIQRLSTSLGVGPRAPKSQESTAKVV